ncbi:MAG TPA: response regulator transcription factor [Chroococcales cyanobacterium]
MDNVSTAVKILVVEDHHATLDGLTLGLGREPGFEIVGTSQNSDEGLALARQLQPDLIVLDLHLPGSKGPRSMIKEYCQIAGARLVIFSGENRVAFVQSVLSLGVAAYLLKSERVGTVAETIRKVLKGERGIVSSELSVDYKKITRSEHEVLSMLGRGLKYQDIAEARDTSVATARKQCETLLLKLGLETREQLIAWAVRNGYGSIELDG